MSPGELAGAGFTDVDGAGGGVVADGAAVTAGPRSAFPLVRTSPGSPLSLRVGAAEGTASMGGSADADAGGAAGASCGGGRAVTATDPPKAAPIEGAGPGPRVATNPTVASKAAATPSAITARLESPRRCRRRTDTDCAESVLEPRSEPSNVWEFGSDMTTIWGVLGLARPSMSGRGRSLTAGLKLGAVTVANGRSVSQTSSRT